MGWRHRTGSKEDATEITSIRWSTVLRWGAAIAVPIVIMAFLSAVDPWLALVPREPGRQIMEIFLRSILIGYVAILVIIPLLFLVSISLLVRAMRRARPWQRSARGALLCGSMLIAVATIELTATAWLAWSHRLPVLPTTFRESSPDGELSLVVLGGSSALGYPYDPGLSVGQIVSWQIEQALPGRKVILDIRAKTGRNLENQHQELAKVARRPDAVIVYSGHNEFLSRFDPSRDAGYAEAPGDPLLIKLYRLSLHSSFCRWVYETVNKHRLGGTPPRLNHHQLIDVPMFTPSEYYEILVDFRRRLEAIVSYCERVGAVAILIIPPGNEGGFEPNRSLITEDFSPAQRADFTARFLAVREAESRSPRDCIRRYNALLEEQPQFAETHFRLGRLHEAAGAFATAREHYIKARDLDGFPVRCLGEFAQVYRDVATRHRCILLDGQDVFRVRSRNGIVDDQYLHDAQHPNFGGIVALSQAVMDALYEQGWLGLGRDGATAPVIDPAACARRFDVDAKDWSFVCLRTEMYYNHLSRCRFDPAERQTKELRWRTAVEKIAKQVPPEQAGVPGIGLPPAVPSGVEWWATPSRDTQTSPVDH